MKKIFLGYFILFQLNFFTTEAKEENLFDRFWGSLEYDAIAIQQLIKIDFVPYYNANNQFKLMAIVILIFGEISDHEYASYHYDDVSYDPKTKKLFFWQKNIELWIRAEITENKEIYGQVFSTLKGPIGHIFLTSNPTVKFEKRTPSALQGQYEGICNGNLSYLLLQTYRSTTDTIRVGNPFGSYKIRGQFAVQSQELCGSQKACVENQILDGNYDFFRAYLTLVGSKQTVQCDVKDSVTINCNSCSYVKNTRLTPNKIEKKDQVQDMAHEFWGKSAHSGDLLQDGTYRGYLFHEYLGLFQRTELDIQTYKNVQDSRQMVVSSAMLFFGDFNSREILSYRFAASELNSYDHQFILERTEDDIDALLLITEVSNTHIKGVWYSILWGKVGNFFVTLKEPPVLSEAFMMPKLGQHYCSPKRRLELDVFLGQTPINTENPFYPLELKGFFAFREGLASRFMISGGSYDFYNGKIGFEMDAGNRVVSGQVLWKNAKLLLNWTSNGFATVMQDFTPQEYEPCD